MRTSAGGATHLNSWLHGTVVDAQEVVAGEIWLVSIEYGNAAAIRRSRETFYVLEATCEVVGRPALSRSGFGCGSGDTDTDTPLPVRADWSAYIEQRRTAVPALTSRSATTSPLLAHLKWAGVEDYHLGISKLWLKRIAAEGPAGDRKREVAERYVLACVIGNG